MNKKRHYGAMAVTATTLMTMMTQYGFALESAGKSGSHVKLILWIGIGAMAFIDLVYELRKVRAARERQAAKGKNKSAKQGNSGKAGKSGQSGAKKGTKSPKKINKKK